MKIYKVLSRTGLDNFKYSLLDKMPEYMIFEQTRIESFPQYIGVEFDRVIKLISLSASHGEIPILK